MKHILIRAPRPSENNIYKIGRWAESMGEIEEQASQNKDYERLGEGAWLIVLRQEMDTLPPIFQALRNVQYRYKSFDTEPDWHEGPKVDDNQDR